MSTILTRAWLSIQAFAKVADAVEGDITKESIAAGLDTMDIDLGIFVWTPSNPGPASYPRVSNAMQYLSTVTDGEVVLYQPEPIDALASFR